ncbi:MAG: Coenzyme F420 hydrogenase/dehydrogenase, beta subunit C-terminal domain [Candidatus Hydrothermarchaeaceae archaeon]
MMNLAYVGLPCQIEGLRKADAISKEMKQDWMKNVGIQIGLLCRENWSYTCFRALLQDDYGVDLGKVVKFDIKKKDIIAHLGNGDTFEFPLEESRPYVRIGCTVCLDFTAELSDISVGAVGSPMKWSTVIARTEKGLKLLEGAEKAGYIETKPIEEVKPGVRIIKRLSKEKLDAATADIKEREDIGVKAPHLHTQDAKIEKLKKRDERGVFKDLDFEIIDTGLCSACGICETVCPIGAIKVIDERPTLVGVCQGHGMCYYSCPRNHLPLKALKKLAFGDGTKHEEGLGNYITIKAVRAKDPEILEKGQDGGAVTALLSYALEEKLIDGAVSVKSGDDPWRPVPFISKNKKDLMAASGTFYSYSTTMPVVKG